MTKTRSLYLLLIVVISLWLPSYTFSQTITDIEYFIDTDPGVGSATQWPTFAPNTTVDFIGALLEAKTLPIGQHVLYIRAKNSDGVWGFTEARPFVVKENQSIIVNPVADIDMVEYFIDEDPGVGFGIPWPTFTPNDTLEAIRKLPEAKDLQEGFHTVGLRARSTDGTWGFYEVRKIIVKTNFEVTAPTIYEVSEIEYYFDNDPGVGLASKWPSFTQNFGVDFIEALPEAKLLAPGQHVLVTRAKSTNGVWGFYERRQIIVKENITSSGSISPIVKLEYYIDDNDPGVGNGQDIAISSGTLVDLAAVKVATPETLVDGQHTITVRAMNEEGVWSMSETSTFDVLDDCKQPIPAFDTELACAGSTVVFTNTSDSLQVDATYRWYLNGDNIIDETTKDATFTYPFPGTYVVALAVRQGTICLDSISTTIEIQPQPVAVFSTSGAGLNQLTHFIAAANNLPDSALWEWDFDGNFTVDDNRSDSTAHTYTSIGTFNPILTITDGKGCSVSVTNPITIDFGGGNSPPAASFLADNGCKGADISFIDISQNIPSGANYSWDFDGNGQEDSTEPGNTTFIFDIAGTYTTTLTIDLDSMTVSASQVINIVDTPEVNFSAQEVCEGSATIFTDLSTPGTGVNDYTWDFNNNGLDISKEPTGISHTYDQSGTHIVSLKINNGYGCEQELFKQVDVVAKPDANFDWNQVCTGVPVLFSDLSQNTLPTTEYIWDFNGDGINEDTTRLKNIEFTYVNGGVYNASLNVVNYEGCDTIISKTVEIIDIPDVAIDINAQCYGQESQMIDLSQKVNASANYYWDFGEAGSSIDETAGSTTHTYASYNSYLVTLTIDNGENCRASTEALVEFADAATPDFETNKLCEGEEVVFTNLSTNVNPAAIYSWDFDGDGNEDSAFPGSTAHTFDSDGTYNAQLTIDNGGNCLAYKTIPLVVTPPPLVDLGPDEILCEAGTVVLDPGTGYNAYLWPDGSTEQTYSIDQIGEYMVQVQDALQCYNTDTIAVKLLGDPVVAFDYSFDLTYQGIKVLFENLSSNADSYEWEYAGAVFSEEEHASMVVTDWDIFDVAVYEICMTAFNDCNQVSICENVYVSPTRFMELSGSLLSAYPSPSTGLVQVDLSVDSQVDQVLLINNSGEVIWYSDVSTNNFEIDLSGYDRGAYYIIGRQPGKLIYQKIIKI